MTDHLHHDPETATILSTAAERARALGARYAGSVTPAEAHQLHRSGAAAIVDVRTRAEHEYVGRIPGTELVEWRSFGAREPNPKFLDELRAKVPPERPVLFLCRSGVRSHAAAQAAAGAGWTQAYNILEGFEGDLDDQKHRGHRGGWRKAGLPWVQS